MKALDLLLLSIAIGLTLFTVTLFASDYPRGFVAPSKEDELAPGAPRNPAFRAVVIHDLEPHRALPFHFVIEDGAAAEDGLISPCPAWRGQSPAAHTSRPDVNDGAISIALRGSHTPAQERALLRLLEKLCREYGIDPDSVGTHAEVESASRCPKIDWDVCALRAELRRRLD